MKPFKLEDANDPDNSFNIFLLTIVMGMSEVEILMPISPKFFKTESLESFISFSFFILLLSQRLHK